MTEQILDRDWESLMARLCLSQLSEAEWTLLIQRISVDEDARRRYVETVCFRESMPYLLANLPTRVHSPNLDQHPCPRGSSLALIARQVETTSIDVTEDRAAKTRRLFRWSIPLWLQAACVAYVIGVISMWGVSRHKAPVQFTNPDRVARSTTTLAADRRDPQSSPTRIGRISGLSPDAAAPGVLRSMYVGQGLRCGEVVQISTGFIRVTLNSGSEVIFTGPAEFSLLDSQTVFIRAGRLSIVGKDELSIQTPLVSARCAGARASFDVADGDAASLTVDAGGISLYSTPREDFASTHLCELRAGDGLFAEASGDPAGVTVLPASPVIGVAKSWSEVEQGYSDYEKLVLSDHPLAYWPLRHVRRNCRVLDLTQHGYDARAIGSWSMDNAGVGMNERGAFFDGASYIEADRKPVVTPRKGFTVEAWAKVVGESQPQAVIAWRWVLGSMQPDCQRFGYTLYAAQSNHWEFWTGSGEKGIHWQRLVSPDEFQPGEWTHLAATFEPSGALEGDVVPGRVALYVNGQCVAIDAHHGWLKEFEWPARIGAAEYMPHSLTSWLFRGAISDVALYNYVLSEQAIRRHLQLGMAAAPTPRIDRANVLLATHAVPFAGRDRGHAN